MNSEDAALLRGQVVRGVVHGLDDAGGQQRAVVETHEGVVRSGVEVVLPYGLASRPAPGGATILLAVGGDQGDQVALPVAGGARLGLLGLGEVALYTDEGTRVHLASGGQVRIAAATEIAVQVGGTVLRVTAAGVQLEGDLQVQGSISASGSVSNGIGPLD
jgi:phage gp45-like